MSTQPTRNEQEPCKAGAIRPVQGKVRELRTAKGWTQDELARRVGCMSRTIQRIEAGECALLVTLTEVATAFKMDVAILLTAPPPPKRPNSLELRLILQVSAELLDQCGPLLSIVDGLMSLVSSADIDVTKIGDGVTISLPPDLAEKLVQLMMLRKDKGVHCRTPIMGDYATMRDFEQAVESDPLNFIRRIEAPSIGRFQNISGSGFGVNCVSFDIAD